MQIPTPRRFGRLSPIALVTTAAALLGCAMETGPVPPESVGASARALTDTHALVVVGASYEYGYKLNPLNDPGYIRRLQAALRTQYGPVTIYNFAQGGAALYAPGQPLFSAQTAAAVAAIQDHRDAGVTLVIGAGNDISAPYLECRTATPPLWGQPCLDHITAHFGDAEAELATLATALISAAELDGGGSGLTEVLFLESYNPIRASRSNATCDALNWRPDRTTGEDDEDIIDVALGLRPPTHTLSIPGRPFRDRMVATMEGVALAEGVPVDYVDMVEVFEDNCRNCQETRLIDPALVSPTNTTVLQDIVDCYHPNGVGYLRLCEETANTIGADASRCDIRRGG